MGGKGPFFAQYGVQAAAALIANRSFNVHDKIGLEKEAEDKANELHQQFKWLLRSRVISLKCNNGQYVCAEGSGASTVVANRNAIGDWERFWLVPVDGGKVALAVNNGQFVCAEGGGGREVVANRNRIGPWEKFKLVAFGGNKVAIRAHNGQYVCAEGGGGRELVADRNQIAAWETFERINV